MIVTDTPLEDMSGLEKLSIPLIFVGECALILKEKAVARFHRIKRKFRKINHPMD